MSLVGDDRPKKVNDLLLPGGHHVELPAHLGEAVVDMGTQVDEVLPKVDKVLPEGIETGGGGASEVADFTAELTDVAVGSSCEYASGRGILLGHLHPTIEVAYLLFESADA
jgi:hypothetical protein